VSDFSNCSYHFQKPTINIPPINPLSGTESDSDSHSQNQLSPDASSSFFSPTVTTPGGQTIPHPPLSAIDEGDSDGDGDEDEDDTEGEGVGWRSVDGPHHDEESVIKAGYLWKKGVRRKVRTLVRFCRVSCAE
jgi:hypothetical protein